jgi:hypothetical protein
MSAERDGRPVNRRNGPKVNAGERGFPQRAEGRTGISTSVRDSVSFNGSRQPPPDPATNI